MHTRKLGIVLAFIATACLISALMKGNVLMATETAGSGKALAHNVFFTLNDSSPASRQTLVDSCKKYLVKHPGVEFFACGTVVEDLDRPVNDRNFDVGLHIVFDSRAAHDKYQTSPDHLKFIEENRAGFKQVRVFDTDVDVMPTK